MTAHDLLVQGRERLANGYLVKGVQEDGSGGMCAIGAILGPKSSWSIEATYGRDSAEFQAGLALHENLLNPDPANGSAVPDFNNAPGTTKEDVLALFDRAIAATAPAPDMSWLKEPAAECVPS